MADFKNQLSDLLTETFEYILKIEEANLRDNDIDASISEVHLIDAIGRREAATISDIASALNITLASVTIAVNKLVAKGFLIKEKNPSDGRSVYISLTKAGKRVYRLHHFFHRKMVNTITQDMTEAEKQVFYNGVLRLNQYFAKNAIKLEK